MDTAGYSQWGSGPRAVLGGMSNRTAWLVSLGFSFLGSVWGLIGEWRRGGRETQVTDASKHHSRKPSYTWIQSLCGSEAVPW